MLAALAATAALGTSPVAPAPLAPAAARLPGFAAELANKPPVAGPQHWRVIPYTQAWQALMRATPATRQSARWNFATSLLAQSRPAEASGVLTVMRQDDPDLEMVPAFAMARGEALVMSGRSLDGLALLARDELARNPEACAWRLRAYADSHMPQQAIGEVNCALPAINIRTNAARTPFVIAAVQAALDLSRPAAALTWLTALPDGDPVANLWRGRAYLATHQPAEARLRFGRVALTGDTGVRAAARLGLIEAQIPPTGAVPSAASRALDTFLYEWRGGPVEERALRVSLDIADRTRDLRRGLRAGATLFRYFSPGPATASVLAATQARLAQALAPASGMPLDQAAGIYWDYRDLAPAGAEGDALVTELADRLQAAGLYARAAQLLAYQLGARTQDVAQGPLSARVASLFILAGNPEAAIDALRTSNATPYPPPMQMERHRVEAVALHLLGRDAEAMAVLDGVPDGARIQQELLWQKRDWPGLIVRDGAALPVPHALDGVQQVIVLRHAVALAMLGRQPELARLHIRYASAFAALPTAAAFDALTKPGSTPDLDVVAKAMAALPGVSPAGTVADLMDAAPKPARATPARSTSGS